MKDIEKNLQEFSAKIQTSSELIEQLRLAAREYKNVVEDFNQISLKISDIKNTVKLIEQTSVVEFETLKINNSAFSDQLKITTSEYKNIVSDFKHIEENMQKIQESIGYFETMSSDEFETIKINNSVFSEQLKMFDETLKDEIGILKSSIISENEKAETARTFTISEFNNLNLRFNENIILSKQLFDDVGQYISVFKTSLLSETEFLREKVGLLNKTLADEVVNSSKARDFVANEFEKVHVSDFETFEQLNKNNLSVLDELNQFQDNFLLESQKHSEMIGVLSNTINQEIISASSMRRQIFETVSSIKLAQTINQKEFSIFRRNVYLGFCLTIILLLPIIYSIIK